MLLRRHGLWGAAALALSFGLGGLLNSPPAAAQEAGQNAEELFKRLDKNGDGVLKADELGPDQARFFERLVRVADKDGNGELSREEFVAGVKAETRPAGDRPAGERGGDRPAGDRPRFDPGQRFDALDSNKDGKLTLDEVPEEARDRLRPVFERLGKDALTKEDFVNAVGQLGGRPGGEGGRPDPARAGEFFNRLDANGDGKVTLDEVPEPAKRMVEGALRRLKKGEGEGLTREEFVWALAEGRPGEGRPGEGRPGEGRPGEARPAEGRGEERRPEGRPGEARPAEGRAGEGRPGDGRPEGRPPLPKFFRTLDTNGDGRLSREELSKAAELLDQLDENKDGQLDPRELLGPPPGGRPGEGRPGEGRPGEGRPGEGRPAINPGERRPEGNAPAGRPGRPEGAQFGEQLFNRLDANKDGKISKDEAQGPLRENFDRFDADKDGFVTLEELRRGMAARLRDGEGRRPNGERPNPNRANPDGQKPEEKKSEEKKPE